MADPISIHGVSPDPSWPSRGEWEEGKRRRRDQPHEKGKKKKKSKAPVESDSEDDEARDQQANADYLGTQIDFEA